MIDRRTVLRGAIVLGGGLVAGSVLGAGEAMALPTVPSGMIRRTLPAGYPSAGRTYVYQNGDPDELVFLGFHGAASDITDLEGAAWATGNSATTGWRRHAATNGYSLVLCEAPSGLWTVGGDWPESGSEDDQYALDVQADWYNNVWRPAFPFNSPGPYWTAGFSNGAAFAWRLAALYPVNWAGCVRACGWAAVYPTSALRAYCFHGNGDTAVPYRGGAGINIKGAVRHFPAMWEEGFRAPIGSRVAHEVLSGGHAMPTWMAARWYRFAVENS